MKKIYILLTDTGTLFTRFIRLYTKKPYNHASIAFDSELYEVYSFGRKTAWNPFYGGFVKEDVRNGLFKRAKCVLYSLTVTEDQMERMIRYMTEMEKQKECYRYNLIGLFGFLLNKPIHRKRAFFCSQFVASVLVESKVVAFNKPEQLVAPYDLQNLHQLTLVYEGQLHVYHHNYENKTVRVPVGFMPIEIRSFAYNAIDLPLISRYLPFLRL